MTFSSTSFSQTWLTEGNAASRSMKLKLTLFDYDEKRTLDIQARGEGVGEGVNPSANRKKGASQDNFSKPLPPRGLVGFP